MKGETGWWFNTTIVVAALCALAAFTSCAGKATSLGAAQSSDAGKQTPAVVQVISADEIAALPQWQQDLLHDPGWNQPTIPQVAETPMPAPTQERLLASQKQTLQAGIISAARGSKAKSASWIDGGGGGGDIAQGESYYDCSHIPGFTSGCWDCINNKAFELNIKAAPTPPGQVPITYVEKGVSSSNHFNTTGGMNNNALCAEYQIFCSKRSGDPGQQYGPDAPTFSEISYRADGGPNAGGDACNGTAFTVKEFIWWKYNQQNFNALPGLNTTALYNILIAPSSDVSAVGTSKVPNSTKARIQNFYCGNVSSLMGGGAIVSIESSTSSCSVFKDSVTSNRLFYTNPIYGVLLKRWQDSVLKSMPAPNNNPWNGDFGWPVQGPVAYNNGQSTLTNKGAYYAWGMYFERGFVWWVDYISNTNVPDEAQAYSYTGSNVFCKGADDRYEKMPTILYGGTGPLGVSVVVEASMNPDHGPGSPPPGTYYEVGNPDEAQDGVLLDMHAHGYGGIPRATDNHYKFYTWAFRDGTIGVTNGVAYDDSTKYVQHSYNKMAVYTVRVQVVDANGTVAYGDSLPIHIGKGSGWS